MATQVGLTAAFITNYNMPERADALSEHIKQYVQTPCDVYLVDNGSDIVPPARNTNVTLSENVQTTGGWLAGVDASEKSGKDYTYYWFLITSTEFPHGWGDTLSPMVDYMEFDMNAVGIHPALTLDSTTSWDHLYTRKMGGPRRSWMLDNIASLWRTNWWWAHRWDHHLRYGWGIDLEMSWQARQEGRGLYVDERVRVKKVTDIGYTMGRMRMTAEERRVVARDNMELILRKRYGPEWWERMTTEYVKEEWK